jgi:hypothetical protein
MSTSLTPDLIRATARIYSRVELLAKLREASEKLATGTLITQATSGTGTGYTRTITLSPADAVELYEAAIQYKDGETTPESTLTTHHFTSRPLY